MNTLCISATLREGFVICGKIDVLKYIPVSINRKREVVKKSVNISDILLNYIDVNCDFFKKNNYFNLEKKQLSKIFS